MATLHQKLAVVIVLAALGGTLWAGYSLSRSRLSPRLVAAGWAMTALLAVQGLFGTIAGAAGGRPASPAHFVIGPLAVLALPAALLAAHGRGPRTAGALTFAGWLAAFALSLRATGTGGLG